MKNKDARELTQLEISQRISNAAKEGNQEEFENGLQDMFNYIHDNIVAQANEMQNSADMAALAQRGVRQLTSEEVRFYNGLIEAMKGASEGTVKMALSGVDKTFPMTIISQVMEDMKQEHPLLAAVDTVNVSGLTKFIVNVDEGDAAAWGPLESEIEKEIASGFKEINMTQNKLSAFMPISQDMLELGPNWLDAYIRTCLSEALAMGYENAIVTGTGKDMPIGMDRSVADNVTVTGGVYPKKEAVAITDFRPATYGALIARLAKGRTGKPRKVSGLIMVVNPLDYYSVVVPATTVQVANGGYANDILPVPTKIIQSTAVTRGEAILGIGKKYFLGVAGNRGIQFSDDYKFLEDQRYYKIVAYGNGMPKDDNAFLRLDISNLDGQAFEVINPSSNAILEDILAALQNANA